MHVPGLSCHAGGPLLSSPPVLRLAGVPFRSALCRCRGSVTAFNSGHMRLSRRWSGALATGMMTMDGSGGRPSFGQPGSDSPTHAAPLRCHHWISINQIQRSQ